MFCTIPLFPRPESSGLVRLFPNVPHVTCSRAALIKQLYGIVNIPYRCTNHQHPILVQINAHRNMLALPTLISYCITVPDFLVKAYLRAFFHDAQHRPSQHNKDAAESCHSCAGTQRDLNLAFQGNNAGQAMQYDEYPALDVAGLPGSQRQREALSNGIVKLALNMIDHQPEALPAWRLLRLVLYVI